MSDIKFISVDEVILLQKSILPNNWEPDINKLEGALYRVQTLKEYENCNDIFQLAAMYLIAIAKAHAFFDANKRTAFQTASLFLDTNGKIELDSKHELAKLTVLAAIGEAEYQCAGLVLRVLSDYKDELVREATKYDDETLMPAPKKEMEEK